MRWTALLVLVMLSGCQAPTPEVALPTIEWTPMDVTTTAVEAFEFRGYLRIAWGEDAFALEAEMEPDLATKTLRLGDRVFTTILERGWTEYTIEEAVAGDISNRLLLWDLRSLTEADTIRWTTSETATGTRMHGQGTIFHAGAPRDVNVTMDVEGNQVIHAVVDSHWGRESPFTFQPATVGPAIPFEQPSPVRPVGEVKQKDPQARDAHSTIVLLLIDHVENRGTVPDQVDADSLALEMAVNGVQWPTNPYDGEDLQNSDAGGHFVWTKCGPGDGVYEGLGWDRTLLGYAFGSGCPDA